jgi:hypothetical protein
MRVSIKAVVLGSLVGLGCAAIGCSDGESGGAGNKDQFLAQVCDEYADCCVAAGRPGDGAQCRAFYAAFAPPNYDQAAADACLAEIRALGGDKCDFSRSTPSCEKVFSSGGSAQPGEACEDDADCAPSDEGEVECASDFTIDATVQQCQVRVTGVAGSTPCVGTVDGNVTFSSGTAEGIPAMGYLCHIADGLTCDSTTGACQALAAVGEPCAGFDGCVTSAYCDFASGSCLERKALGEPCGTDDECQEGGYCDQSAATDSTCLASRAQGEACTTNSECASDNCTNQECGPVDDFTLAFICGGG